jgi:hypothetical protein
MIMMMTKAAAAEEAATEAAELALAGEGGDAEEGGPVRLFDGLVVLVGRETPMTALELVLSSFGATVVWVRVYAHCLHPLSDYLPARTK